MPPASETSPGPRPGGSRDHPTGPPTITSRSRELLLAHDRDLSRAAAQTHEAELALEVQRRDIAREIHDLVGHTINVMVVHAGAGRRGLERDPNEARDALVTIEEVGRGALDELDGLLGSLSRAPGDRRPVQGLEDVAGLVARVGRAGPVATLDDRVAGPVPAAVGATAYRVVQEVRCARDHGRRGRRRRPDAGRPAPDSRPGRGHPRRG